MKPTEKMLNQLNNWQICIDPLRMYNIEGNSQLTLVENINSTPGHKISQIFFMIIFFPITVLLAAVVAIGIYVNRCALETTLKAEAARVAEAARAGEATEKQQQESLNSIANTIAGKLAEDFSKELTDEEKETFKQELKEIIETLPSSTPTFKEDYLKKLLPLIFTEHSRLIQQKKLEAGPSLLSTTIKVAKIAYGKITAITGFLKTAGFLYTLASATPALFDEFLKTYNGTSAD